MRQGGCPVAQYGLDNRLIPRIKRAADTKYPMSHTTGSTILVTSPLFLSSNHLQHSVGDHETADDVDGGHH